MDYAGSQERAFAEAVRLHQTGEIAGAIRLYRQLLQEMPQNAAAFNLLGLAYCQQGELEEAASSIHKALELEPDLAEAHYNLGNVLQALKRHNEAIQHYEQALTSNPDDVEALNNLGTTLKVLKRYEQAILYYGRALALKPDYAEAHMNLGNVLYALNRHDEAIRHYEQALALKPDNAEAHLNLGNMLRSLNRYDEAIQYYEKAIALPHKKYNQPIIHQRDFTAVKPPSYVVPLFCRHSLNKYKRPSELTILLVHDRNWKTVMERSLEYIGIYDYTLLKPKRDREWCQTIKPKTILDYLRRGECKSEYILFSDSDDAIIRGDPRIAIELLEANTCEMLISSTRFNYYPCMPDVEQWARRIARENGLPADYEDIHLCTGVYVAKRNFLREVLEETEKYITPDDLPTASFKQLRGTKRLCEVLSDFPRGVGSDQLLMRFLHPKFYPRMKIDYEVRLALRNL